MKPMLDQRVANSDPSGHEGIRVSKVQLAGIRKKHGSAARYTKTTYVVSPHSPGAFRELVQRLTGVHSWKDHDVEVGCDAELSDVPRLSKMRRHVSSIREKHGRVPSKDPATQSDTTSVIGSNINTRAAWGPRDSAHEKPKIKIGPTTNEQNKTADVCTPGESEKSEGIQPQEVEFSKMQMASEEKSDVKDTSVEVQTCSDVDSGPGEVDSCCSESDVEDLEVACQASRKQQKTAACISYDDEITIPENLGPSRSSTAPRESHLPIEALAKANGDLPIGSARLSDLSIPNLLMQGGLGLTEPPEAREWERAKEICLMQNNLSELPENPKCNSLSTLYLQRNQRLRAIPTSFFNCMPALEVLNLSRTRIRSLPDSLFQLVKLKRLFLNECILLRTLSGKIGGLKNLEVLDLEGTKLMGLPKEMEQLINLSCLEVSILGSINHGKTSWRSNPLIPSGMLSALLQLVELNIDVGPDAEWWDSCVGGLVDEICSLERLSALKFNFPRAELLRKFRWPEKSVVHPGLSHFRLIVGKHACRIMSRSTADAEFELERWDKYLKYVNGEHISAEVKEVLRQADAFFLDRHINIRGLSDFGIQNMDQLKCCVLGECNELRVLVDMEKAHEEGDMSPLVSLEYLHMYYMKNFESIWRGPVRDGSLSCLKSLILLTCPKLTTLFTPELLNNLCSLEELSVEDCPSIVTLMSCQDSAHCSGGTSDYLPLLKKLSLHYLPELSSITSGLQVAPKIEWLSFYDCPDLKRLELSFDSAKRIRGQRSWWEGLQWSDDSQEKLDHLFVPIEVCSIP